jgi:hypothetical protein
MAKALWAGALRPGSWDQIKCPFARQWRLSRHGLLEHNAAVQKLLHDIGYCFIDIVKPFKVA